MTRSSLLITLLVSGACASTPSDPVESPPADPAEKQAPETKKAPPTFEELAPSIGSAAPTLELTTLEGEDIDVAASFKTGPTVLVFGSYS